MMLRVLHTADWHIGSFPGPEVGGENARLKDIETCLGALVREASVERPDLAVISGDVFHQARVWSDRGSGRPASPSNTSKTSPAPAAMSASSGALQTMTVRSSSICSTPTSTAGMM